MQIEAVKNRFYLLFLFKFSAIKIEILIDNIIRLFDI